MLKTHPLMKLTGTMSGPYGYFFLKGNPEGTYPSLASRRLVVKHYLESLADASSFTQDIDDVVYDMEVGGMYRMLFCIPILVWTQWLACQCLLGITTLCQVCY